MSWSPEPTARREGEAPGSHPPRATAARTDGSGAAVAPPPGPRAVANAGPSTVVSHPLAVSRPLTQEERERVAWAQAEIRTPGSWNHVVGEIMSQVAARALRRPVMIESAAGARYSRVFQPLEIDRRPEVRPLLLVHLGHHYDALIPISQTTDSLYHAIARSAGGSRRPERQLAAVTELKTQLFLWMDTHREDLAAWADLYGPGFERPGRGPLGARVRAASAIEEVEELVPIIAANALGRTVSVTVQGEPDAAREISTTLGTRQNGFSGEDLDVTPKHQIGLFVRENGHVDAVRKIPGFGDCFYQALLHQRDGGGTDYESRGAVAQLRETFAAWLGRHKREVVDFLPEPPAPRLALPPSGAPPAVGRGSQPR